MKLEVREVRIDGLPPVPGVPKADGVRRVVMLVTNDVHVARRFYRAIGKTIEVSIEGDEAEVDVEQLPEAAR